MKTIARRKQYIVRGWDNLPDNFPGGGGGGGIGWGYAARFHWKKPYPIYDQNLRYSLPCLWSDPCIKTFQTCVIISSLVQINIKLPQKSIIEILSCGMYVTYNNRGPQLSYDWLLSKHPRKPPCVVILKIKRYGTGLTQRVSMEDGSCG